jgi:hypothetical protein
MELWDVMDWGVEPLHMNPDSVLFAGIKKSEWENQFYYTYFRRKYLTVKFVDEDGNITEKNYLELKNGEPYSSISVRKILDNSTVEVCHANRDDMFFDAVPRDRYQRDVMNYTIYEIKFSNDEFGKIPWDDLDDIDRKRAVQCLILAGALESFVVKYIVYGKPYSITCQKFTPLINYLVQQELKILLLTPWLPSGSVTLLEQYFVKVTIIKI